MEKLERICCVEVYNKGFNNFYYGVYCGRSTLSNLIVLENCFCAQSEMDYDEVVKQMNSISGTTQEFNLRYVIRINIL